MKTSRSTERRRIEITGIVQGVGFRPFVGRLATDCRLMGFVRNHPGGVTVEVEGKKHQLEIFIHEISRCAPPLAEIQQVVVSSIQPVGESCFAILPSTHVEDGSTLVPPDAAVCEDCLAEMHDESNPRYRYPFTNCTNCGPRFTIIRELPYDRASTTMDAFEMCESCRSEYVSPSSRRFHAEPICCPQCGPELWFASSRALFTDPEAISSPAHCATDADALSLLDLAIVEGKIVAVKGIGGFHLVCDAANHQAIDRLRRLKNRPSKPFAIMVPEVGTAEMLAEVSPAESKLLTSPQKPIVLLQRRPRDRRISYLVAPGCQQLGIMLPYTPLHHLLMQSKQALVMTSGNLSGEPICRTNQEAADRLAGIADAFLLHNRDIYIACDDSVVVEFDGKSYPIRRSRGYAPTSVPVSRGGPSVLSVGGELKATFCLTDSTHAHVSHYLGDMEHLNTLEVFDRSIRHFLKVLRISPQAVACDMHPDYFTTSWAKQYAREHDLPLVEVQHHKAHIAALCAEQHWNDPVIGVCFDGSGYGTDGAIWGGEFFCKDDEGFQRVAHLKNVALPGGDTSIKRPYRLALSHLASAGIDWNENLASVRACSQDELRVLQRQLAQNIGCTPTSSMGRLFDAVASLLGVRQGVTYEGQAAIELEAICGTLDCGSYSFQLAEAELTQIDPRPVLEALLADINSGVPKSVVASRFHLGVAELVLEVSCRIRKTTDVGTVALSGGVFQNMRLLQATVGLLKQNQFRVLVHRLVPPNDGGISLGQAVLAQQALLEPTTTSTQRWRLEWGGQ